ncbi:hypothetical protein [Haladaptatus cibarius]|uniref:hypothetical protein n=1 Tax=Haladaptatus cibarius TaxID=453847 RepID=UPI001185744F|nr:hypothetical protein [Haladaptatus cibarius]
MFEIVDLENKIAHGIIIIILGVASSLYFPLISPVMAVYFFYRGWNWYISSDSTREKMGILLMVFGVFLVGYSYFAIAGYITSPGFENN